MGTGDMFSTSEGLCSGRSREREEREQRDRQGSAPYPRHPLVSLAYFRWG